MLRDEALFLEANDDVHRITLQFEEVIDIFGENYTSAGIGTDTHQF